jgi:hypothetical protein
LAEVEPRCGFREAAVLDDGREQAKVVEIDRRNREL